jgi:hypothetical protein
VKPWLWIAPKRFIYNIIMVILGIMGIIHSIAPATDGVKADVQKGIKRFFVSVLGIVLISYTFIVIYSYNLDLCADKKASNDKEVNERKRHENSAGARNLLKVSVDKSDV